MNARRWLAHPRLLERHPYYAAVLAKTSALVDPSIDGVSVAYADGKHYLLVGASEIDPERELGLLLHVVHHIVLGHLTHPKLASPAHPELMRLAMEISANESVPYPIDGARWQDYEDAGLRPRQSTRERYDRLCEARREGTLAAAAPPSTCDEPAAGGILAGERDEASLRATRALVRDALDALVIPPHGDAALLAGREPDDLLAELSIQRAPRTQAIDWREAMRRFATRVRAPAHTWARPSRRFPDRVGELPGRTWALAHGAGIKPRVVCAIDTSGSLTLAELAEIAAQLAELGSFAEVTIVECDARVQRVYRFEGELASVRGRGGTDLRPPFEPEILGRYRPDGLVYFTDGLGPFPGRDPGVPTLWILTKPIPFRCPWGARAHVRAA